MKGVFENTGSTIKGLAKLALQSRKATICKAAADTSMPIIIMGNGPSLSQTIAESSATLRSLPAMAVNFAANAPEFITLKPRYYILVDPHFFSGKDDDNLHRLFANLSKTDWQMTLIVPAGFRKSLPTGITTNPNISIATVNAIGVEGFDWFTRRAYRSGRAMPRPRNVLIPAIMAAIQMGFKEIYITGADHSWMKTISVDDDNRVVSIQPHFYKDNDKELKRIRTDYMQYPLHQIVHSFYVAFKAYHDIQRFAQKAGIRIYNATPGSFIDAFPRHPLPCTD